jgi:hypothetical protein
MVRKGRPVRGGDYYFNASRRASPFSKVFRFFVGGRGATKKAAGKPAAPIFGIKP